MGFKQTTNFCLSSRFQFYFVGVGVVDVYTSLRISVGSLQPSELSYRAPRERFLLCVPCFFCHESSVLFLLAQLGGWWRWFSVETYLVNVTFYFLRCWLVGWNVNPISWRWIISHVKQSTRVEMMNGQFFLWLQIIVCWQCTNRCVSAQVYLVLFKVDVYCVLPFFHGKSPSIPPFWEYCFPFFQAFVQQIQVYFGLHHRHFRKKSIVVLKKHVVTCYDLLLRCF